MRRITVILAVLIPSIFGAACKGGTSSEPAPAAAPTSAATGGAPVAVAPPAASGAPAAVAQPDAPSTPAIAPPGSVPPPSAPSQALPTALPVVAQPTTDAVPVPAAPVLAAPVLAAPLPIAAIAPNGAGPSWAQGAEAPVAPPVTAPAAPVVAGAGPSATDEAFALPPLKAYTPGVLTAPAQLATLPGTSHLVVVLQAFNVDRFDALWGKSAQAVLAVYPGAKADETSDIRPFQQVLVQELPEKDKAGKPLKVDFTFINDQLFQIGLRQGALNKDEKKELETLFGRPFDRQTEEGWKVKTYCWDDGNLVVKMREKDKLRALVVADRARHEVNAEWDRRPYAAWLANERGAQEHLKHPISFRAAEKGYNDAVALFPTMGHALVNLCHLYYDEESLSRAVESCNKVIEVSKVPSALAEAQLYLGRIAMAQGRREDAITAFNAAASATISTEWLLEDAHRHLDLISGKLKKADLQAALEDALCAQIESGPTRVRMIVGTYGFGSLEDLSYKALSAGVDTVGVEARIMMRCHL